MTNTTKQIVKFVVNNENLEQRTVKKNRIFERFNFLTVQYFDVNQIGKKDHYIAKKSIEQLTE